MSALRRPRAADDIARRLTEALAAMHDFLRRYRRVPARHVEHRPFIEGLDGIGVVDPELCVVAVLL